MTEGNGLEPIETAIFNALTALEDVSVAVATVDQAGPLPGNWRTQFGDLRGQELTAKNSRPIASVGKRSTGCVRRQSHWS